MDFVLPFIAITIGMVLFLPAVKNSLFWQATVTPLASIIGSGFLVIAPLLASIMGQNAPWAMLIIVVTAYGIGGIVRFNIRYVEPLLNSANPTFNLLFLDRVANFILSLAYVVSITFYLRLLSSFVLEGLNLNNELLAQSMTTVILCLVALIGWSRGLRGLIWFEEYAVSIKLSIIGALLFGLLVFDSGNGFSNHLLHAKTQSIFDQFRQLAGMLLVVQGFETSRYLGLKFNPELRIKSMKFAQVSAGIIYLGFILLITPLFGDLNGNHISETMIIELIAPLAIALPPMLIVAAVMSQFSAAIADTVGAGGIIEEESRHRIKLRYGYLVITGLCIVLVWSVNIFEIITLASRAFAAYYFIQALIASIVVSHISEIKNKKTTQLIFLLAAITLALIMIFAVPVE